MYRDDEYEHEHHGHHHRGGHCGCHCRFGYRHFLTKEEKIARLEEYLKEIQQEAKGVEEYLAQLRKV